MIGQSISIVLGGGGQKAAAHIGIIEKLISKGVPIDMISGTSAGAFIAAVYAMTRDTKTIESIVRRHSKNNHEFRDPRTVWWSRPMLWAISYGP